MPEEAARRRVTMPGDGAGRRNRTDIIGLEGRGFTTKLYPRIRLFLVRYMDGPSRYS